MKGSHGLAWEVKQSGPAWSACMSFHYVNLPAYHPMLKWFVVILSHLRPTQADPNPAKNSPDCTHELVIGSVDPEGYLFDDVDPDTFNKLKLLHPLEVWHQFQSVTDSDALTIRDHVIHDLLDGQIDPNHEDKEKWTLLLQRTQAGVKSWNTNDTSTPN